MNKKSVGIIAAVSIMALGAIQMSSLSQQRWSQKKIEKTPRQKEHGKLFKHSGKSLLELADERTGDVTVFADSPLGVQSAASRTTDPIEKSLQKAVCNRDAVVVGLLKDEAGQFNEDNTFVFTDYNLQVEEVIKNNPKRPIQVSSNISITRDGGVLIIDGRSFRATLADFKAFEIGKRLLLFLRYLPSTESYVAYAEGSFGLEENSLFPYGARERNEITSDAVTLLNNLRQMTKSNCDN